MISLGMLEKYKWLIIIVVVGGLFVAGSIALAARDKTHVQEGYDKRVAEEVIEDRAALDLQLEIRRTQDEIRNNRPDVPTWTNFMREQTY